MWNGVGGTAYSRQHSKILGSAFGVEWHSDRLHLAAKFCHAALSIVLFHGQRLPQQRIDFFGQGGLDLRGRYELLALRNPSHCIGWYLARQEIVEGRSEGIDVRALVGGLTSAVLFDGRETAGSGALEKCAGAVARLGRSSDAEIDKSQAPGFLYHNVGRLQVTKQNGRILSMEIVQHLHQRLSPFFHLLPVERSSEALESLL